MTGPRTASSVTASTGRTEEVRGLPHQRTPAAPVPEGIARVLHDGAPALFVSPHLDDAVLSCAALMRTMVTRARVTVVTLFSAAAPPPHTRAARTFLRQCGAAQSGTLFRERCREDIAVLDGLGVGWAHLGHPDALFRRRRDPSGLLRRAGRVLPELDHRYPTFRFDIALGRVSRGTARCARRSPPRSPTSPAARRVRPPRRRPARRPPARAAVGEHLGAVLYADFPYTARDPAAEAVAADGRLPWSWADDLDAKRPAIAGYGTQVDALFPGGEIPLRPETY